MKYSRPALLFCLFVLPALWLSGAAQPDRTAALEKAKGKFEADSAKAEEALIGSLDKAIAKAKGNKQLVEKLTYERDLFVSQRIVPTSVPVAAYLKQRNQAVTALETAYLPITKELTKAKKGAEAEALEREWSDLLKTSRGYGLAVPDLESKTALIIENKSTGLVIEASRPAGTGTLILAAKAGKKKPAQCWAIDREEKGVIVRNWASGEVFYVGIRFEDAPAMHTQKINAQKETPDRSLFRLTEARREVVISAMTRETNGQILTATEVRKKGVVSYELTLEKKEAPPPPGQLWTLTEAK